MDARVGIDRLRSKAKKSERRAIFEPEEVEVGYEFILRLVSLRLKSDEPKPSDKKEQQERFSRAKDEVARAMGYDSYGALPKGAKSFESRCASQKRCNPRMKFSDIAQMEREYNRRLSDTLRKEIEEELVQYAEQARQREERRYLVRRMCCYSVPFVFQ